jgi:mono/diheme cytochrome c family protein
MALPGKFLLHAAITLGLLIIVGGIGAAAVVLGGVYDIAAIYQHTQPVYTVLHLAMKQSVRRRSAAIEPPALDDAALVARGFPLYQDHCAPCHGAPGVAPAAFGKGMNPLPPNLVETGREWPARDIYWVVENGIRMTGMPAWKFRFSEEELWAVTAFVQGLPALSPRDYAEMDRRAGPYSASRNAR